MPVFGFSKSKTAESLKHHQTASDFKAAHQHAEQHMGRIAVAGRYHRLPKRLTDDFEVSQKVVGEGFNGSVFLAKCRHTGTQFAVKNLSTKNASPEETKQLANEVQVFLEMDHPHVARLMRVYESEHEVSLVMEHMSGGELFDRLVEKTVFPELEAASTIWQMLLAVNYLHHEGITHRDLKLENFLYDEKGSDFVKLIDFGFSKFSKKKKMNEALGTLSYVAPEVLKKDYSHGSCDLCSLGCVAFMLLFGYMPFGAKDDSQLMRQILSGEYKQRPDRWSAVSKVAQDFVKDLLVVNPRRRLTAQQALAHPFIEQSVDRKLSGLDHRVGKGFLSLARATELKKACLQVMAWCLTLEQRRKLRSLYINVGATKDGVVLLGDLETVFREKSMMPKEELDSVMHALRALDLDGDEELHYSDFLAGMMAIKLENDEGCGTLIQDAFRRFEVHGRGYITPDSVKVLAGDVPEGDLEDAFNQVHLSRQGRMNVKEFMSYMMNKESSNSSHVGQASKRSSRFRVRTFLRACLARPIEQAKRGFLGGA